MSATFDWWKSRESTVWLVSGLTLEPRTPGIQNISATHLVWCSIACCLDRSVNECLQVELKADILVPGFSSRKLGQIPCEDIMVRFPIPECWIYLFRVEKHFRYGSVKSTHRRYVHRCKCRTSWNNGGTDRDCESSHFLVVTSFFARFKYSQKIQYIYSSLHFSKRLNYKTNVCMSLKNIFVSKTSIIKQESNLELSAVIVQCNSSHSTSQN